MSRRPGALSSLLSWVVVVPVLCLTVITCGRVVRMEEHDRSLAEAFGDASLDSVWALAFSSDGTRLAWCSVTGRVELEDLTTHHIVSLRSGPAQSVRSLSFSGDGSILAAAGYEPMVDLWDARTGATLKPLAVEGGPVNMVEFSPSGRFLAIGSLRDGLVTIREWATGKTVATWPPAGREVQALVFSSDEWKLCVADADGTIRVGDVAGSTKPTRIAAHRLAVTALAYSPDGRLVASGCSGEGEVRLWDPETGALQGVIPVGEPGANAIAFSQSGKILATAGLNGLIRLWNVDGRYELPLRRRHGRSAQSVAFSPDGKTLASGGIDGSVRLWELSPEER